MNEKCKHCRVEIMPGQEAYEWTGGDDYILWHERCAQEQNIPVITRYYEWAELTRRWGL